MRSPKQIGYKVFCALMTAVTAYFLCGRELAEAAESNRRAALSAAQAAANLGIDAEQITNPDAWLAKQKANAERKRQNALQQMRRFTHADEQEARTRSAKGEARRVTEHEGEKVRRELASQDKGKALGASACRGHRGDATGVSGCDALRRVAVSFEEMSLARTTPSGE